MECQVCYETATEDDYQELECSHSLCKLCLSKLCQRKCPFCRAPINLPYKEQLLPVQNDDEDFYLNEDDNVGWVDVNIHNFDFSLEINNYNQRVRHRRRRNRRSYRERTVNTDISRIPTIISEEEVNEILNNDSLSGNNSEISKSTSDAIKQKARFKRNRWKYCNSYISSKYVRR